MNFYKILTIPYTANLLDICKSYQIKCQSNPENIFLYTKALTILIDKSKRIIYDSILFKINITTLINLPLYDEYQNIDEYELIPFIYWLEIFSDYLYDYKYFTSNKIHHQLIDTYYQTIINIIDKLKNHIDSFYLA